MSASLERMLHLIGWVLFTCSPGFFVIANLKSGDTNALIGSLFFFVACFAFIVPMLKRPAKSDQPRSDVS